MACSITSRAGKRFYSREWRRGHRGKESVSDLQHGVWSYATKEEEAHLVFESACDELETDGRTVENGTVGFICSEDES